jgi:hypothetical protein
VEDLCNLSAPLCGDLHGRLGGLDLHDRLVQRYRVALGDEPGENLTLSEALTEVGQAELLHA